MSLIRLMVILFWFLFVSFVLLQCLLFKLQLSLVLSVPCLLPRVVSSGYNTVPNSLLQSDLASRSHPESLSCLLCFILVPNQSLVLGLTLVCCHTLPLTLIPEILQSLVLILIMGHSHSCLSAYGFHSLLGTVVRCSLFLRMTPLQLLVFGILLLLGSGICVNCFFFPESKVQKPS